MSVNVRSIVLAFVLAFAFAGVATGQSRPAEPIVDATHAMELGIDAAARGDHERALSHYRNAAALVPSANLPHRYAGDALVALDRKDEAIESYETYLRIKPDVSDGALVRARIQALYEESVLRR